MDEELEVIPPPPQEPCHSSSIPSEQQQQSNNNQRKSTRARIAKITATIIGAAVGNNNNLNDGNNETLEGWSQRELEDNFIGLRIREADTLAELKEMRQKVFLIDRKSVV